MFRWRRNDHLSTRYRRSADILAECPTDWTWWISKRPGRLVGKGIFEACTQLEQILPALTVWA